jgi:hypothetical protein
MLKEVLLTPLQQMLHNKNKELSSYKKHNKEIPPLANNK